MRRPCPLLLSLGLVVSGAACQAPLSVDQHLARDAERLELQLDSAGELIEIEYHIPPDTVPANIRGAMDRLHPGGAYIDAERETHGGQTFFELKRLVEGRAVEAMFTTTGELHSEEIEVGADQVPEVVRSTVAARYPAGRDVRYEEIRDGARRLEEFHVKLVEGGQNYKVLISPSGELLGTFLELPAEIELPVD